MHAANIPKLIYYVISCLCFHDYKRRHRVGDTSTVWSHAKASQKSSPIAPNISVIFPPPLDTFPSVPKLSHRRQYWEATLSAACPVSLIRWRVNNHKPSDHLEASSCYRSYHRAILDAFKPVCRAYLKLLKTRQECYLNKTSQLFRLFLLGDFHRYELCVCVLGV